MPITVSLAVSWQGRYSPEELAHIHEALLRDEALDAAEWGRTAPHDWEALLTSRLAASASSLSSWFQVPYDESQDFHAALEFLCDYDATTASRLEFFPGYLFAPIDLPDAADPGRRWRVYSGEIMALRWLTVEPEHTRFAHLADLYRWGRGWCSAAEEAQLQAAYGGEIPVGDRLDARQRARGYYIQQLGDLADQGRRAKVPGFVQW